MIRIQEARELAAKARLKAAEAQNHNSKNTYLLIATSFDKVADDLEYLDHLRAMKRRSLQ